MEEQYDFLKIKDVPGLDEYVFTMWKRNHVSRETREIPAVVTLPREKTKEGI